MSKIALKSSSKFSKMSVDNNMEIRKPSKIFNKKMRSYNSNATHTSCAPKVSELPIDLNHLYFFS